ncbi:alpha-glucuronidase [Aspergillus clavatus NRRL 1]|uniref:Probable alpha-glucuronidase A n=1 Tax=Aspergillus clavatus (strain ATCC 1007 / CBS 513.65 / DSM 816 / NCTC 3887 / NRRL 1 / QM 1276 / 107) TaxID=344612 RepID=AGUA_ASPCL|nr:alpha-glucuronidase [Aspergillus clavatus NRRL 1]A1CC12.1 RecName: Full=Probable alpha-glucuronidase A; AltName: Full=Alpha-glucosiduronase A; Flags: Precursor [Aspergillus clavatus NRRL 1]EAW13280.1 alpha-glucuronidase [Aspergillus clavatus NRRL 1]
MRSVITTLTLVASVGLAVAENGFDGWLRYAPVSCHGACQKSLPSHIVTLDPTESSPISVAGQEIQDGLQRMFKMHATVEPKGCSTRSSVIIGTLDAYNHACKDADPVPELEEDGFWLNTKDGKVQIIGQSERGALYGAYEYLSMLSQGNFAPVSYTTSPHAPIRWVNQWDNMDGSMEHGYGGLSIFFKDGVIPQDLSRVKQYARLLASIRINGIIVNNVNANASLLKPENMDGLARIADIFRPYGVKVGISLNFASPSTLGGLNTYDPLDESVISWWGGITDELYKRVPDMAGYLVKANSEGQPGPTTYNRTLAEGANLFARALKPHGGIVMFRAFVYDHHISEENWYNDRANAAVDFFKPLDGKFEENVVVQIKYGPIDFQVREPVSPLFANLYKTNTAIELQVTQEYLGQQSHLVYLPPLWQTILGFDLRVDGKPSPTRDIISGQRFNRPLGGWAAVVNVGTNTTWLGSHLALSNLYAYGRLAWEPTLDSQDILQDWIRMTFGLDRRVLDTITKMSMESWPAYENYSGNLGIQTLTDILYTHYGPNPASQDGNGWGQWTRADHEAIGMDRTIKNGTKFTGQYPAEVAQVYENIETTPDDLLLWFHHVPYTQRLQSGKTVIQHFYDAHYAGADTAQTFVSQWESLRGKIDPERYEHVLTRLIYQAGHSIVWRDAINEFYHNLSGIADEKQRVGHHPWRIEAEDMKLDGYVPYDVNPFETASNTKAIVTATNSTTGTASTQLDFKTGKYDLGINYYDFYGGKSQWTAYLNDRLVGQWQGNNEDVLSHELSVYLDGHSATRITFRDVKIHKGDRLKIVGKPDGMEPAPLDYVVLLPQGIVD